MPPKTREERLFGASCLKLKLQKTLGERAGAVEIYQQTISDLGLTDEDVDVYLDKNRSLVEAALAKGTRHGG